MKCIVLLAFVLVAAYAEIPQELVKQFENKLHEIANECKAETGATDDDVAPMLKHDPPTNDKGKCFVACLNKKIGFQDKSGKIDKEHTLKMVEQVKPFDKDVYEKMKKVADKCLSEVTDAANECETAGNMFVCIRKERIAAGIPSMDFQP